jgi:hypothetical protein
MRLLFHPTAQSHLICLIVHLKCLVLHLIPACLYRPHVHSYPMNTHIPSPSPPHMLNTHRTTRVGRWTSLSPPGPSTYPCSPPSDQSSRIREMLVCVHPLLLNIIRVRALPCHAMPCHAVLCCAVQFSFLQHGVTYCSASLVTSTYFFIAFCVSFHFTSLSFLL